ncbi:MAG: hypothetical protein ACRDU0_00185 [Mycobacterium sp.]
MRGVEDTLRASEEQRRAIEAEIESVRADRARLSAALIETTAKVQDAERGAAAAADKLASLNATADELSRSLERRRAVIADVLAALQRMGSNPPPAILVKPNDMSEAVRAAPVIFSALSLAAAGLKVAAVAARLRLPVPGRPGQWWHVPVSTARSWLSRFAGRAERLRQELMGLLPLVDPQGRAVTPSGSLSAGALAALDAVTAGLRARFAGLDTLAAHEVAAHLTGGLLLAPSAPAVAGNTTLMVMAAVSPS